MKFRFSIFLLFIAQHLFAQEYLKEFGSISPEEIELKAYEKDTEAKAMVLFDIGESVFFDTEGGYDIRFTRTKRIKIFSRSASEYAEIAIPFYVDGYGKTEIVKSIEAFTYNFEDGQLIKKALDPSTIYEEKVSKQWKVKKFVFPDVKQGSILEYKYVLETPFHFNLLDWYFQDRIPTLHSQYTVKLIPFYEYVYLVQGITEFDYQDSRISDIQRTWGSVTKVHGQNVGSGIEFHEYIHTYALKDIPAFKDESYITSPEDYLIKMDFQLAKFHSPRGGTREIITSWSELNKAILKDETFGKYIKSSKKFARKILKDEINLANKSESEKSKMIIEYVKSNFSWNGLSSKYASKSVNDFMKQKSGNAADINLFLIALLDEAGLEAQPVILSTRDHGKISSDYPFDHYFNYVIALVNGQTPFLTDATENTIAYNRIPLRCINEKGLLVREGEVNWLSLHNNLVSLNHKQIYIAVDPDKLIAQAVVSIQMTEYESYLYKKTFNNDTTEIKNYLLQKTFKNISSLKTYNYDKNNKPYTISFESETEIEKLGGNMIISPFLNFALQKNELTQESRSYPVDFVYAKADQYNITINIPSGFKVSNLPASHHMEDALIDMKLDCSINSSVVNIKANYTLKKSIYEVNEYDILRHCIDAIVKQFNEQIIFEKI